MNQLPPHREFQNWIGEKTAKKSKRKGLKAVSTNALIRQVIDFIRNRGFFASRLQSVGTYRDDLKKFVPSQQRPGLPDIVAVVNSRSCWVEIKTGRDVLSKDQIKAIAELRQAGASVFVASDFAYFETWFTDQFLTAPFS